MRSLILYFAILRLNFLWAGPIKEAFHPVKVTLVSEKTSLTPYDTNYIGIHFLIEPHWHIYWRNSGDSGTPPTVKWDNSRGVMAGEIQWPLPKRILTPPLVNYGYEGNVLLLVPIKVDPSIKLGTKVKLLAHLTWLVCKEKCLPGKADLGLSIPIAKASPSNSKYSSIFEDTKNRLPVLDPQWNVTASQSGEEITLQVSGPKPIEGELIFFPWNEGQIENSKQISQSFQNSQSLTLALDPNGSAPLRTIKGILSSSKGALKDRSLLIDAPIAFNKDLLSKETAKKATTSEAKIGSLSLWKMLLFALIGGMILNLMPCVFPILSIKILGFVEQSGKHKSKARRHGWSFVLGVIISFWILTGVLIVLRAAGQRLGWGFQLQSPHFLFGLCTLLFFMALNFLGLFDIGNSLMGVGDKQAAQKGYAGSFYSGILATLVATPCSAPFMGTAIGFALAEPPHVAFSIFTSLAIGMALPYLLLSYSPALLKFLPPPGRWMEIFKQAMAFPLFATVAWLVWIFGQQVGIDGVFSLLISLLLYGFAVWLISRWPSAKLPKTAIFVAFAITLVGLLIGFNAAKRTHATTDSSSTTSSGIDQDLKWEPYSQSRIQELNKKGTPIFVDFTAAWCVSCQVNEKVVFGSSDVKAKLKQENVVLMKADWTNGDPIITDALSSYHRSGIPFYLLYGKTPNAEPKILPEVLTPGIVLEALKDL